MGITDIFLLVILVSVLVVGFFWGAARSLFLLAAWLFAFLAGAYLQLELGGYLASQWTAFVPSFNEMAAYGIIFVGLMIATPVVIMVITRGSQRLSRFQVLDDLIGAFFAVFVGVLSIAAIMIILSTFYGTGFELVDDKGGPVWTADLYQSLRDSNIGTGIEEQLIPIIGTVIGPLLPPDVREVFG